MAFSNTVCWEIRTTASDTNGGGFNAGATGTDFSLQDAAQITYTDMVIGTPNTTFTSVLNSPAATLVGNIINVTSGTGFTVRRYQVLSVAAGVATVDKALGTIGSTGGNGKMGGALASITAVTSQYVRSNKIFVKATATYVQTATATFATGAAVSNSVPYTRLIGYTTTRGDGGRATIQLSTNSGLTALRATGECISFENFTIDCNNLTTSTGVGGTNTIRVLNVKVSTFKTAGISNSGKSLVEDCEITGGVSGATAGIDVSNFSQVVRSYVHDNVCPGITALNSCIVAFCLITNNTGASSDGMTIGIDSHVFNNTIYGSGRDGIVGLFTDAGTNIQIRNNILSNNGAYGLDLATSAGFAADPSYDGNAYYSNTSGARTNCDDTTVNKQNGVAPYTNTLDKTLSGSPFTNAAGGDFSLNNTAGAGASCRAGGTPGAIPGISQVGYIDMGCLQHQESASGTVVVDVHNTVILNRFGVAGY